MKLKPGQICRINNILYRAHKRTNGCKGCAFENDFACPGIINQKTGKSRLSCYETSILLKRA